MKRLPVLIILAVVSVLLLSSCTDTKPVEKSLQRAEADMEDSPKAVLEQLDSLDRSSLTTRKLKAKYALLYSMALDKNYIDLQNDSIIAPAVEYYRRHGSADDRLKTYYYWGRIAANYKDYEEAISRYIIAEQYAKKASDKKALGRLYRAQTVVYKYCYDNAAVVSSAEKAANVFLSIRDTSNYIVPLFNMMAAYLNMSDSLNARRVLDRAGECYESMTEQQRGQYFANRLILCDKTSPLLLRKILTDYENEVTTPQYVWWLPVANAYYLCGEYSKALSSINNYDYYGGKPSEAYYWQSGLIYESLADTYSAMCSYKNYIEYSDDRYSYLVSADIRFIRERYENQIKMNHKNHVVLVLALSVVILFLAALLVMAKIRRMRVERQISEERLLLQLTAKEKETARYKRLHNTALTEIERLKEALESKALDKAEQSLINERLGILNRFTASKIVENLELNKDDELKKLVQNRDYFIESTRVSFLIEQPKFVNFLKNKGLTDYEIGYCCLYVMGLKGKNLTDYLGSRHIRISSAVRKKLGLNEHDTNLDKYLQIKLAETS